ncbi:MAG: tryptophanase [Candidatus Latescibacterota bacterium]
MHGKINFFIAKFKENLFHEPAPCAYYMPRPYRSAMIRFRSCRPEDFEKRGEIIEKVGLNAFMFPAQKIPGCDLLSDSGTTTMTTEQWAQMLLGDEAYGSNEGYFALREQIVQTFGPSWQQEDPLQENMFLFHQGRSAEHAFFGILWVALAKRGIPPHSHPLPEGLLPELKARIAIGQKKSEHGYYIIPNNSHFDTTEGNVQNNCMIALNLPCKEHLRNDVNYPFRGNIDLAELESLLEHAGDRVPLVYLTITNNTGGGQPVSMRNIKEVRALTRRYGVPFFFDACRFAENAWFIQKNEADYNNATIPSIIHEMFEQVDGFHISFKKDGMVNIGGAVMIKEGGKFNERYPGFAERLVDHQILTEGHPTYGGLAGRDLKSLAEGLRTVVRQDYLDYRIQQVIRFGNKLVDYGIPIVQPVGAHAVYIDMDRFFDGVRITDDEFRGIAFTALLLVAGHRLCELGIYAFGKYKEGHEIPPDPRVNFVRASVPRLTYEDRDLFSAAEAIRVLHQYKDQIPAVDVLYGRDLNLRHFKSRFRFR